MTIPFQQLPIGARFEFRGRRYCKVAMSMAHDEERCANVFRGETDVMPDLLSVINTGTQVPVTAVRAAKTFSAGPSPLHR